VVEESGPAGPGGISLVAVDRKRLPTSGPANTPRAQRLKGETVKPEKIAQNNIQERGKIGGAEGTDLAHIRGGGRKVWTELWETKGGTRERDGGENAQKGVTGLQRFIRVGHN